MRVKQPRKYKHSGIHTHAYTPTLSTNQKQKSKQKTLIKDNNNRSLEMNRKRENNKNNKSHIHQHKQPVQSKMGKKNPNGRNDLGSFAWLPLFCFAFFCRVICIHIPVAFIYV